MRHLTSGRFLSIIGACVAPSTGKAEASIRLGRCKRGVWGHRRSHCTGQTPTVDRRRPLNTRFARWIDTRWLCPCVSIFLTLAFGLAACGTIRTMPYLGSYGSPKIYSGARLDFHAIVENESDLRRFRARPPKYPLLDIPFSLVLDTAILPVTFPAATYELLFGP